VADSSRYDVFGLAEEVLKGQTARACRMLAGLRGEGVAAPVALWALTREVRLLLGLHAALAAGDSAAAFGARQKPPLWDSRLKLLSEAARRLDRPRLQRALLLAARADRIVKGQEPGDDWDAVLAVCACLLKAPGAAPLLLRRA
jgi:DNA polymerase-3 subunit delta